MPRTKKPAAPAQPKPKKETLKSLQGQLEIARNERTAAVRMEYAVREQHGAVIRMQRRELTQARAAIERAHEMFTVATTHFDVLATSLSLLNRLAREAEKKAANGTTPARKRWFASAPAVSEPCDLDALRESLSLIARLLEENHGRASHFAKAFAAAKNPNGANEKEAEAQTPRTNAADR